jgi:uncharacterized protein (DUF58 family)
LSDQSAFPKASPPPDPSLAGENQRSRHFGGVVAVGGIAALRALASYDVFPAFSAQVRRLFYNPFGVLSLAAVAALLCGLFLHTQGFYLLGGVLTVLLLGVTWPRLTLRALSGRLTFEQVRVTEGERAEVCLTLRNALPWSAWGLAVRGGFADPAAESDANRPAASIASAPGWRSARCRWTFVPARRGVYPLTAPRLTSGFPFGLWENRKALAVEAPLLVWPRTFPVGPVPLTSGNQQVEGNVSRHKVGSNGDVLGVRPYRRGDSPRRIHWGQSARHDRLIVCELQANARPVVQLVLDTDPCVHAGTGPDGSREWAVRIAASLARGWVEAGALVGGVWGGHVIPTASGVRQVHRLLDSLARLADAPAPALAEILAGPACRGFRDGLQVIVTTDVALAGLGRTGIDGEQRWVIIRAAAFAESDQGAPPKGNAGLPVRPWLWVDGRERLPGLLRGGWKEAVHGS